jgi:hypothetical protein
MVAIRVHHWTGMSASSSIGDFILGRTTPSFRIALAMEEAEWNKPFRNVFDRSDRKKFLRKCCLTF